MLESGSCTSCPLCKKQSYSHCYRAAGIVSKYSAMPGMVAMHGGLPPSDSFPFTSLGGGLLDVGTSG